MRLLLLGVECRIERVDVSNHLKVLGTQLRGRVGNSNDGDCNCNRKSQADNASSHPGSCSVKYHLYQPPSDIVHIEMCC